MQQHNNCIDQRGVVVMQLTEETPQVARQVEFFLSFVSQSGVHSLFYKRSGTYFCSQR